MTYTLDDCAAEIKRYREEQDAETETMDPTGTCRACLESSTWDDLNWLQKDLEREKENIIGTYGKEDGQEVIETADSYLWMFECWLWRQLSYNARVYYLEQGYKVPGMKKRKHGKGYRIEVDGYPILCAEEYEEKRKYYEETGFLLG